MFAILAVPGRLADSMVEEILLDYFGLIKVILCGLSWSIKSGKCSKQMRGKVTF